MDNGRYLPKAMNVREQIINAARDARFGEGQSDTDAAFEKWYEVSALITEFRDEYLDEEKLCWAKANSIRQGIIGGVIGFLIGVAASIAAAVIMNLF